MKENGRRGCDFNWAGNNGTFDYFSLSQTKLGSRIFQTKSFIGMFDVNQKSFSFPSQLHRQR